MCFTADTQANVSTVSPIGPDEVPPPYQSVMQSGMPMVTCRVCQAMIDISGKRDQHVVKCSQCNEATVRSLHLLHVIYLCKHRHMFILYIYTMYIMNVDGKIVMN